MKYVEDLKNATRRELKEWEAEWRDTVKRRFEDLGLDFDVPAPGDDDYDDFVERLYELAGDGLEWWKIVELLRERDEAKAKKAA